MYPAIYSGIYCSGMTLRCVLSMEYTLEVSTRAFAWVSPGYDCKGVLNTVNALDIPGYVPEYGYLPGYDYTSVCFVCTRIYVRVSTRVSVFARV